MLAACGGDDGPNFNDPDANPNAADAAGDCNPVTNSGCGATEKCAELEEVEGLKRTTCVPNGSVPPGGACESGAPGATTGYDNCQSEAGKGYACAGGSGCSQICSTNPNSCGGTDICQLFNATFEDTPNTGLCLPSCDPVKQDCANEAAGCYFNIGAGGAICGGTGAATQDQVCEGPPQAPTSCFLNGCAKGFAPELPDPTAADGEQKRSLCSYYCTPASTYDGQIANAAGVENAAMGQRDCLASGTDVGPGVGADSYQCRYLNTFYAIPDGVTPPPDSVGFCVPATGTLAGFGNCKNMQYTQCIASNDGTSAACKTVTKEILCNGAFGCINSAELEAMGPLFPQTQEELDPICNAAVLGRTNAGLAPKLIQDYFANLAEK